MKKLTIKQASSFLNNEGNYQSLGKEVNPFQRAYANYIQELVGFVVELEYKFHPKRRWRIDYAIPKLKIAIEVEGGLFKKTTYFDKKTGKVKTHIGGRHNTPASFLKDTEKYNELAAYGWLLIRATPENQYSQETLDVIQRCAQNRFFLT